MYTSLWYNFWNNDEEAKKVFAYSFKQSNTVNRMTDDDNRFTISCFGSYGRAFRVDNDTSKEFYFALAARKSHILDAIASFNSQFKNIKIRIVDQANLSDIPDRMNGSMTYTDKGVEWNRAKGKEPVILDTAIVYLLNFEFAEGYNDLSKYVMRVPLGFLIRMFTTYTNVIDNWDKFDNGGNHILFALDYSNSRPGNNGWLISDYIVEPEVLFMFDDIEYMNKLFDAPYQCVQYLHPGSYSSIIFGEPVEPYSIYYLMDHKGESGGFDKSNITYRDRLKTTYPDLAAMYEYSKVA